MSIERSGIVARFAESIGQAKAETAVDGAASDVGLRQKDTLSDDEAGTLLDYVVEEDDDADTEVCVSANAVKAQLVY
jgi:hypothetical protein